VAIELGTRLDMLRFLIRDRDTKFVAGFDEVFHARGIEIIKTRRRPERTRSASGWSVRSAGSFSTGSSSSTTGTCGACSTGTRRTTTPIDRTGQSVNPRHKPSTPPHSRSPTKPTRHIRRSPILGGLINRHHHAA
jgi:hypothetical protein